MAADAIDVAACEVRWHLARRVQARALLGWAREQAAMCGDDLKAAQLRLRRAKALKRGGSK